MNGINYLVDTNFLIHLSEEDKIVIPFLDDNISISYITELELLGVFARYYHRNYRHIEHRE